MPAALLGFHAAAWAATPPRDYWPYARQIKAEFYAVWGPDQDSGRVAAQIHAESWFRAGATSPAGAVGLSQFMKPTASWLTRRFPSLQGFGEDPRANPRWAIRACVLYDRFLWNRSSGWASIDERWGGAVLASYNAGQGGIDRERAAAPDRTRWFGSVELACRRRLEACAETRGYVHRIFKFWREIYRREP